MSDAPGQDKAGPQTRLPVPPQPSGPPPGPPLPPTEPERGGMRALTLSAAGLLLLFFPVPGAALLGLGLLIAGVVVGVRARRRARRILTRAPGAVAGIVIGAIGIGMCVFAIGVLAVIADDYQGYVKCQSSALTNTDKQACRDTYLPRIERRLHLPKGELSRVMP